MKLNLAQTKLVGQTMKLDLKTREYQMLCEELEKYKKENIDENDERLYELFGKFQVNHDEIVEIKKQLKEIESIEDINESMSENEYSYEDIFKCRLTNKNINNSDSSNEKVMVEYKESLWWKIKRKIKELFKF